MAKAKKPSGPLGKRLSPADPGGGVPDLFNKLEILAQEYAVDSMIPYVIERAAAVGDSIDDIPPQFLNRYFWLSIRLANRYVEGCKLEPLAGRAGRPGEWPRWRLEMLAWTVDAVKRQRQGRARRLNDSDACRALEGHGAWPGLTWKTLRRRLAEARKMRGNPSP